MPHFLRLFQIGGIIGFFFGRKVAVKLYQFRNPFGGFVPRKGNTRVGVGNTAPADFDSLSVVPFVNPAGGNLRIRAADPIFLFEKRGVFALGQALLKLLIDTVFAIFYAASIL